MFAQRRHSSSGRMAFSSVAVVLCCLAVAAEAQLAFHTDANTNSFTLKTPGLQQSFTRYFGGQGANLQQQQQLQQYQQPQQAQVSCWCSPSFVFTRVRDKTRIFNDCHIPTMH